MIRNDYGKNTVIAVDDGIFDDFLKSSPQSASILKEIYSVENVLIDIGYNFIKM